MNVARPAFLILADLAINLNYVSQIEFNRQRGTATLHMANPDDEPIELDRNETRDLVRELLADRELPEPKAPEPTAPAPRLTKAQVREAAIAAARASAQAAGDA